MCNIYSKYYTPYDLAHALISNLNDYPIEKAIDLCCGSGNLLKAAKSRWPNINLIGIDITKTDHVTDIEFIQQDGRDYADNCNLRYELVLANPPFAYTKNTFMSKHPLYESLRLFRLEDQLLISNLSILADQGTLLIIMPSTFVDGDRSLKLRKFIAANFSISKIIKIPANTFTGNISTYALHIHKSEIQKSTDFMALNSNQNKYQLYHKDMIEYEDISAGKWTPFQIKYGESFTLTDIYNIQAFRGNISSSDFSKSGTKVLHTSTEKNPWNPSIRYISNKQIEGLKVAQKGDILINRIGKLAGLWIEHKDSETYISDCIICVRSNCHNLTSLLGENIFLPAVKGVAAKHVTMRDVLSIIRFELQNKNLQK